MNPPLVVLLMCLTGYSAQVNGDSKVATAREPQLQAELLRRVKVDQDARSAMIKWMKDNGIQGAAVATLSEQKKAEFEKVTAKIKDLDAKNTKWLKGVIEKYGWPTAKLVGKDGASAAWLLVQHADAEPKFQRRCLDLMAKLPKAEVSQTNLAYLTDRVLLAEGKKQLYATQFTLVDGKWKPRPLEDEENVDKRRAEAGLPPMAEYIKMIEKMYGDGKKE